MPVLRKNCVVLDTSILPRRPSVADIKKFLDDELKLDMTLVKSIQTHNVKNVVYLTTHCENVASKIAADFHLKHFMDCEGKRLTIPIPIYVDSNTVDVRLNDLPEEIDNVTIATHMRQYGEVICMRNEVWNNYFPGLSNGVRVVRMQLSKPIPSYITILDEMTTVSYFGMQRTCKYCQGKLHPKLRCSQATASSKQQHEQQQQQNDTPPPQQRSQQTTIKPTTTDNKQWPTLPKLAAAVAKNNTGDQSKKKEEPKRQRSIDSDSDSTSTQAPKRMTQSTPSQSDSSVIVLDDSPNRTRGEAAGSRVRTLSFSWIEDEVERQQIIEEHDRRIEAFQELCLPLEKLQI